ncbi:hypothetical protein T08_4051 [Trichinella sp. T8]|nr:hypothetical protein T08_4051 [Trichinella sp. T8]
MVVLHHLDDFDDPRNCLQTSRVVVEVCLEDALLSCLRPALNRLLEQRLEELLSWSQSLRHLHVPSQLSSLMDRNEGNACLLHLNRCKQDTPVSKNRTEFSTLQLPANTRSASEKFITCKFSLCT